MLPLAPLMIARRIAATPGGRARTGTVIAVAAIAVSTIVMMWALAVVKGFQQGVSQKVEGFEAQLSVTASDGGEDARFESTPVRADSALTALLADASGATDIGVAVTYPVMLKTDDAFEGLVLKSTTTRRGQEFVASNIRAGEAPADTSATAIAISTHTARALQLEPGVRLQAFFFSGDGALRVRPVRVSGIYDTGFPDYDRRFLFASRTLAASLARLGDDEGTRIEMYGAPEEGARALQQALLQGYYMGTLPEPLKVGTARHRGAAYYDWLDMLDTNVVVILVLMGAVAAFTLTGSLLILILERIPMIGLLKALGMDNGALRLVFVLVGERLVLRGLLWGNVVGLGMLLVQRYTGILPLDAETYFLESVPVEISVWAVVLLNVGVIVLSALVLLLPTHVIAGMRPSATLRYE